MADLNQTSYSEIDNSCSVGVSRAIRFWVKGMPWWHSLRPAGCKKPSVCGSIWSPG